MMKKLIFVCLLIQIIIISNAAQAYTYIAWDRSPKTMNAGPVFPYSTDSWSNTSSGQNWADEVTLSTDIFLTGIDIYSNKDFGYIGQDVNVKIWTRDGDFLKIGEIDSKISVIDDDGAGEGMTRKHADIQPYKLSANTSYWVGMSGEIDQLGQAGLTTAYGGGMALFNGDLFSSILYNNEMAFRLEGNNDTNPVPEASTMLMVGIGLFTLLAFKRYVL